MVSCTVATRLRRVNRTEPNRIESNHVSRPVVSYLLPSRSCGLLLFFLLFQIVRYPSFGGTSGSAVVAALDGRVVGIHTQMLWLNEHDSAARLVDANCVADVIKEQEQKKEAAAIERAHEKNRVATLEARLEQVLHTRQLTGTTLAELDQLQKTDTQAREKAEADKAAAASIAAAAAAAPSSAAATKKLSKKSKQPNAVIGPVEIAAGASSSASAPAAESDSRTRSSSSASLIMADIGHKGLIGQFQTLTHKSVLHALKTADIISAAESSALAMPEVDGFMYD
jgi:hypothetical protein